MNYKVAFIGASGHWGYVTEGMPLLPGTASRWAAAGAVYLALVLTVLSAVVYVVKARRSVALRQHGQGRS